jgi:hypothetical protein
MGQLISSINLIQIADSITANVSEQVKKALNSAISEWKKVSVLLYKAELLQLSNFVQELKKGFDGGGYAWNLLEQKKEYQEISEVKVLADMVGLDNHETFEKINSFFQEIKNSTSEEEQNELMERRKTRYLISAAVFVVAVAIMMLLPDHDEAEGVLRFIGFISVISFIGAIVYFVRTLPSNLKSSGEEKIIVLCDNFSNYLESVSIKPNEIDLKLLGQ